MGLTKRSCKKKNKNYDAKLYYQMFLTVLNNYYFIIENPIFAS